MQAAAAAQLALMMSMLGQSVDGDGSGLPAFLEQMDDEVSAIAQRPTPRDGTTLTTDLSSPLREHVYTVDPRADPLR